MLINRRLNPETNGLYKIPVSHEWTDSERVQLISAICTSVHQSFSQEVQSAYAAVTMISSHTPEALEVWRGIFSDFITDVPNTPAAE